MVSSSSVAKTLILIRHGLSEMNVHLRSYPYGKRGFYDPPLYDARLTAEGMEQARALVPTLVEHHRREPISLIIASPLSRALSTAELAFSELDVPTEVSPLISERAYLSSDRGRSPAELAVAYPRFAPGLRALPESWWWQADAAAEREAHTARLALQGGREPLRGVALPVEPQAVFTSRLELFKSQLLARPERSVAVVVHWAVIYSLLGKSLHNCEIVVCKDTDLLPDLVNPPG